MSTDQRRESFWKRHLDQIGVGGTLIAALCCLGFPALLAILSAVGLGFLIHDAILIPLLVAFLAITLWGLYLGARRHHRWAAFALGLIGGVVTAASVWFGNGMLAALGIATLVLASFANVWLAARGTKAGP